MAICIKGKPMMRRIHH